MMSLEGSKDAEDAEIVSGESMKNSLRLLDVVPKPSFNRLFKGFKNFSQLFGEYICEYDVSNMSYGSFLARLFFYPTCLHLYLRPFF